MSDLAVGPVAIAMQRMHRDETLTRAEAQEIAFHFVDRVTANTDSVLTLSLDEANAMLLALGALL